MSSSSWIKQKKARKQKHTHKPPNVSDENEQTIHNVFLLAFIASFSDSIYFVAIHFHSLSVRFTIEINKLKTFARGK